ncbi:MAG TPA: GntR family transcriptional regulator [Solirubrobacteraceae bacterium]|jgi:DNA-binding GntR family transcriptional regulator|nr:GntR family transcriptional regulator [Solirubrobacteraceae bacterium]
MAEDAGSFDAPAAQADGEAEAADGVGRTRGQAARVHERLRQAIIQGELVQGTVLSQVELARRFGVSRTPLREALRMLQAEGFVDSELNRKVRVASFTIADLEQLYASRIVLEALGISQSARLMTEEDLEQLHRCLAEMDRCSERRDVDGWEEPHSEFHRRLVVYAGQRTAGLIAQLADAAQRYRRVYVTDAPLAWSNTATEHRAIVAALEARDPQLAADELARHLARTALTVIAMVDPGHDPAPVRAALALAAPNRGAEPA